MCLSRERERSSVDVRWQPYLWRNYFMNKGRQQQKRQSAQSMLEWQNTSWFMSFCVSARNDFCCETASNLMAFLLNFRFSSDLAYLSFTHFNDAYKAILNALKQKCSVRLVSSWYSHPLCVLFRDWFFKEVCSSRSFPSMSRFHTTGMRPEVK